MAPLLQISVFTLLAIALTPVPVGGSGNGPALHRQKREWIKAPRKLKENFDYTTYGDIAKIRSDKENFTKILYYLKGPGADQPPMNRFIIDQNTGFVRVTSILDREEIAVYHLIGVATYADGRDAEKQLDLNIVVEDVNDCTPVVKSQQVGSVSEMSAQGTFVMQIIATDNDEENTDRSKIFYSIAPESNPGGMFSIDPDTGKVWVQSQYIDRETKDTYKLIVRASDMNGQPGGNTGSGEVEIKVLDINDNIPTLEKETYEGSLEENTVNVEVMRVKAIDMDLINTDNWQAVYHITSGNEAGYFSITTDSETNEGIITVQKALDYEEMKEVNLQVSVSNKAAYNFGSGSMTGALHPKSYPIKINVKNQKEGPRFQPNVKVVTISEDQTSTIIRKVIANYAAIDSDTLQKATNVRYAKIVDEDNWLFIDEKTADISLNKLPDRESKYLVNGTYYAKVICISNETPSKTATGTIAIQVEDFNDHCPILTTTSHSMCLDNKVIYVTAVDKDEFPNSAPFEFSVVQGSSNGKWAVEQLNETTAILRDQGNLWPGKHKVSVVVKDQQGKACADVQVINLAVCTCTEQIKTCSGRSTATSTFGPGGILLLLLGLLLLLLLPLLLLFCLCGGVAAMGDFKAIPFDTTEKLMSYHTEGQGEDKEVPLLHIPVEVDGVTTNARNVNTFGRKGFQGGMTEFGAGGGGAGLGAVNTTMLTTENMHMYNQYGHYGGHDEMDFRGAGGQNMYRHKAGAFDGMAVSDQFLEEYYLGKTEYAAQQSQEQDGLQAFGYEGRGSLAGSVGCCSLLENDNDLSFLDDLGPKFKTLAEICQGSTLVAESESAHVSLPPVRPVSPVRPSTSTHSHVHTHTETVRDRDRVSTLDTSNVASGSSTIFQEERITEKRQGASSIPKVIPSQTLLIQQPTMYYAATPMYVVEPNPQVVLVAGGSQQAVGQVGTVGLNTGLMQVGGLQGSQGVVLVDRQVGVGGGAAQVAQGISQGTVSRSRQVLVVENGSAGGEQGRAQGSAQIGQRSAVAGLQQGFDATSQGLQVKGQTFSLGSRGSAGSNEDFALSATPRVQGSQRVVIQKKVLVTERNVESSTRA
ncbi:desmoglein-2-like protein [Betta splendens]|uniref:Desmoglein-2-like protein n=1 Tax=Betta splendens TaxID=158456 RepID=A0A6P7KYF4_BETSP|nr:desmoglein-2-like protein [Betta splendens]